MLTRDLATALRGRSITLEVFPLSFREYLTFRRIEWVPSHADSESLLRGAVETYLYWGGFPEIVLAEEALRPLILEEYASLMLYRDVVERYGVRNEKLMRELLRHCFRPHVLPGAGFQPSLPPRPITTVAPDRRFALPGSGFRQSLPE